MKAVVIERTRQQHLLSYMLKSIANGFMSQILMKKGLTIEKGFHGRWSGRLFAHVIAIIDTCKPHLKYSIVPYLILDVPN